MPPFSFAPAQTNLVSFSSSFTDPSPSKSFTVHLTDATEHRTRFRDALKDLAGQRGDGELHAVVEAAQGYLPLLLGLSGSLDEDEILLKSEPMFNWKSSLNPSSSTYNLQDLGHELIFTLISLSTSLNNLSSSLISSASHSNSSVNTHLSTKITTPSESKRQTDNLSSAADNLCRSSGIFSYIAEKLIPGWEAQLGLADVDDEAESDGRPMMGRKISKINPLRGFKGKARGRGLPECRVEVMRGLAMMTLADANSIAILKLLSPFHPSITLSPTSLPLPKNHPPPSLLAKLNIHCASLYSTSRGLLKTSHSEEIDPALLDYLRKESGLAEIRARKWLGVESGESPGGAKIGTAIAWLEDSLSLLASLRDRGQVGGTRGGGLKEKMKGLRLDRDSRVGRKERKGRLDVEEQDIRGFLRIYKHLNDTVHFQPIPQASELQNLLPLGRPVLQPKPYTPPLPAFGPRSEGYVSKKLLPDDDRDSSVAEDGEGEGADQGKRTGQGGDGREGQRVIHVWDGRETGGKSGGDYF